MTETPTFVTHLECSQTGKHYPADTIHNLSETGKPLLVRYDLEGVAKALTKETLAARAEGGFWRYRELLPVRREENVLRLGTCPCRIDGQGAWYHADGDANQWQCGFGNGGLLLPRGDRELRFLSG